VLEGLYDIVSDKAVGVNLLMAQVVVTFPVVIHFTQPLQAFLAGLRPRPAGRERAASKAGSFWTHASISAPPHPGDLESKSRAHQMSSPVVSMGDHARIWRQGRV